MTDNKITMEDLSGREFFTTCELANAKWFPIKSDETIRRMIKNGILKAINVSARPGKERYSIPKEEVIRYLVNLE